MLYTTGGKLIVINQDVVTSDYYITQYDYTTTGIDFDINIGTIVATSIFECECTILITDDLGIVYAVEKTSPYTLTETVDLAIPIGSATQVGSCVVSSLSDITTTTTTTI
jgi:hypothetical protein